MRYDIVNENKPNYLFIKEGYMDIILDRGLKKQFNGDNIQVSLGVTFLAIKFWVLASYKITQI